MIFIPVNTPTKIVGEGKGYADLKYVEACKTITGLKP